jgi:hypothetical protein
MTAPPEKAFKDAVERWRAHRAGCSRCADGPRGDCEIGEGLWVAAAEARGRWFLRRAHTAAVRIAIRPAPDQTDEPALHSKRRTR